MFSIDKEKLDGLLKDWAREYEVHVPCKVGDITSFELYGGEEIDLEFQNSRMPPIKKIMMPESETLYRYESSPEGYKIKPEELDERKRIVFGARPCDCAGIERIDKTFYQNPPDPYYDARRRNTIIIGLACNKPPFFSCFCTSVGLSPHSTAGMDVLLTDLGGGYLAEPMTERGKEVLKGLRRASESEIKQAKELHEKADELLEKFEIDNNAMDFDARVWEDEAERCIGCGICTFLCPSCSCFTLENIGSTKKGKMVRIWETCQFPAYSIEASGHNPRPNRKERVRQRLFDKYRYSFDKFGEFDCVGCGRCVDLCPVNIDVREIMLSVKEAG